MLKQLSQVKEKYLSLKKQINNQKTVEDPKAFASLSQEFHHLEKIHNLVSQYEALEKQIQDNKILLKEEKDQEILSLAKEEIQNLSKKLILKEKELKIHLLPEDPNDKRNVILEIRAGAGGDEASLFCSGSFFRV